MNYLLKFQPPGVLVEVLLRNSKRCRASCLCRHCLRCRLIYLQNVQEFSTYISPYKLWLVKHKELKKTETIALDENTQIFDTVAKGFKLNTSKKKKSNNNKVTTKCELKTSVVDDSTESYDLISIPKKPEAENCWDKFNEGNISKENNSVKAMKENIAPKDKLFLQKECATRDDHFTTFKSQFNPQIKNGCEMKEKNVNNNNLLKLLKVSIENQNKSLKKSVQKPIYNACKTEEKTLDEDYQQILSEREGSDSVYKEENTFDKFSFDLTCFESYLNYINSSLDILITNDKLEEAFSLFNNLRKKVIWKSLIKEENKNLVYSFNILLNGLADKAEWYLLNKATNWMREDNVKLNSESFSAILYCLGETKQFANEKTKKEEVQNIIKEVFANNIALDDIFSKTSLNKKKIDQILSVIQSVVPYFNLKPVTINLNSDCPLTKNLYDTNNKLRSPLEKLDINSLRSFVEEQLLLEKKFLIEVKAVSKNCSKNVSQEQEIKIENLKKQWRSTLTAAVEKAAQETSKHLIHANFKLSTYVTSIPQESLVNVLMNVTEMLVEYSGSYGPTKAQTSKMIGNRIFDIYQVKKKELTGYIDISEDLLKRYVSWYLAPQGPAQNSRQAWQMLIHDYENIYYLDSYLVRWPQELIKKLGEYFLNVIIEEMKFTVKNSKGETVFYPILYTLLRYHSDAWREELKSHPYLASMLGEVGFNNLSFRADEMPMVCPPKPWRGANNGGYLIISTDFIRRPMNLPGKTIKFHQVPQQLLYPTLDSLNALQGIPWMVNEDVLDIALEVFRNGGSKELNVPHYPNLKLPKIQLEGTTLEERKEALANRNKLREQNMNDYGLWCEALYRFSLVNHFRKRVFWLPQNCDFRGRVYPVPALLNHIGADLFRSLLIFAESKPLGPSGLDWLKIHVINLTGTHKKKPVEERLNYANEVLPLILDSAERPLKGHKWWTKAEEPWQTLAGCMEIKKALSHPNPEEYLCNFPIHQDGSCNGLQHYAALGKDVVGAESVNLVPFQAPQDVYAVVAEMVDEERKKDAERGVEIARVLDGFISRKIVKQTVMTTVYGVTLFGAKRQIWRRLEEIPDFPEEYIVPAGTYLGEKTFLSIQKMFKSAKQIQEWFINCAEVISLMNDYVQWPTPLGLPVVQHYGKHRLTARTEDFVKKKIIVPNKIKQKNAFPPNFIHTLDSCHMMLTALYCEQAGITFAAVHDCFWTHPCSVETMNKICREQFVSLHSRPILEDLAQFFKQNYLQKSVGNKKQQYYKIFDAVPKKGDFDLKKFWRNSKGITSLILIIS